MMLDILTTCDYNVVMTPKSSPVSVRISKQLEALVDQEARRTGRSRSAVLEALADEALRMRLFPGSRSAARTGSGERG